MGIRRAKSDWVDVHCLCGLAQVKAGVKLPPVKALSRTNADEVLWPRRDDVFIVSYPKVSNPGVRGAGSPSIRF